MGCSRTPGILGQDDRWGAARTRGPLGVHDQADPNWCTRLGDTPGPLGVHDHADPTLPGLMGLSLTGRPPMMLRLADGTALAMPCDAGEQVPERAPWMNFAEAKAREFKGAKEAEIQKTLNFHTEVHTGQTSMVGSTHAWCAAFVNWCLMQAGYEVDNKTFADHVYAKGRAHAFYEVTQAKLKKGERSVPKVRNPLFVQIDKPVFGAVAMVTGPGGRGHHVGFVYAKSGPNELVLLGGNQSDTIKFSPFNIEPVAAQTLKVSGKTVTIAAKKDSLMFLVPADYAAFAQTDTQALSTRTAEELNVDFGITVAKPGGRESTR